MIVAIGVANTTHCHGFNRTIAHTCLDSTAHTAIVANIPLMLDRLLRDNMANKHIRLLIFARRATRNERTQIDMGKIYLSQNCTYLTICSVWHIQKRSSQNY